MKTLVVEPRSAARDALTAAAPHRWPRPSIKVALHRMQRWIRVPEAQVGLVAAILSIAAFAYYSHAGLLFAYNDAVSHLMLARRVLDSRTPGLAQFGGVWLPLNHILMLPLVWITPLFRDGFAAAFPSMVAYVIAGVFMYKLASRVLHSRLAGYVAAAVLLLNPSLLYLQSTSMSETDLICCTVLLTYFLVRWSETERLSDLILCAGACLAATLIRYDGWALTASAAVYVLVTTWRRHGWVRARAIVLLYGLLAFAGCVGWIIYNQLLFGSGLSFYNGALTAKYMASQLEATGSLSTPHNLLLSLHVYTQAVIDNLSAFVSVMVVVGLLVFLLRRRDLAVFIVLIPFVFNWLSLYLGSSVIDITEFPLGRQSQAAWNGRYGLEMLPAAAFFVAVVFLAIASSEIRWKRYAQVAVSMAWIMTLVVFAGQQTLTRSSYALADPLYGGRPKNESLVQMGVYLHQHYDGQPVLVSYVPFAPVIFFAGLPDHAFITDSEGATFTYALAHPDSVQWIVIDTEPNTPDLVQHGLEPGWKQHFVLRATFGADQVYEIYERIT